MGASLVIRQHPWAPRADVQRWAQNCASEDQFEHGASYSGYWNMKSGGVHFDESRVFASPQAAEEHISEENDKHGCLTAVPALQRLEVPRAVADADAKLKALNAQRSEAQNQVWNFERDLYRRAKAAKSAFKGCSHCGSRISVQHLNTGHSRCPVCNQNLLRTDTDTKKETALKARLARLEQAIQERHAALLKKQAKGKPIETKVWVVGGWCAS